MGDLQALEHPVGKKTKQRLWGLMLLGHLGMWKKLVNLKNKIR